MTNDELQEILRLHKMWHRGEVGGVRASLRSAVLMDANLEDAYLRRADLSGADLRRAYLRGAYLRDANLRHADLCYANLRGADLRYADFSGADLSGADLRRADLRYADFSGANLSSADLRGAYLSGADLREARLYLCVGDGTHLRTLQTPKYWLVFYSGGVQIGCKNFSNEEWMGFSDEDIDCMDVGALNWWKEHRDIVKSLMF